MRSTKRHAEACRIGQHGHSTCCQRGDSSRHYSCKSTNTASSFHAFWPFLVACSYQLVNLVWLAFVTFIVLLYGILVRPPSNKGLQLTTDSWAFLNRVAFWRRDSAAWR